jgi:hypothetical protein
MPGPCKPSKPVKAYRPERNTPLDFFLQFATFNVLMALTTLCLGS